MKILFVCSETKQLGVGYLINYLKQNGHEAFLIVDPWLFDNEFIRIGAGINKKISSQKWNTYLEEIKKIKPDLVGFSVNTANFKWAVEKAGFIKNHLGLPIIFGGPHPTILAEETLKNSAVDMVAIGDAEETMLEFANNPERTDIAGLWFKRDGQIIRNPIRPLEQNLDKYPFPADEMFYKQLPPNFRWYTDVLSGRGCPYNCTYCNNATRKEMYLKSPSWAGKWVRQRSVEGIMKELIWRKENHKSKKFDFKNEVFALDDNWLRDFSRDYKKFVGLPFYCYFSLNLAAKEERVALLKDAGCVAVHFGLQSGSERVRREVLDRYERNAEALVGAENCHKHKLNFSVHCIVDLPFETQESVLESAETFNIIRPNDVSCYSLLYFPGAKIIEKGLAAGLLTPEKVAEINRGEGNMIPRPVVDKEGTSGYMKYALFLTSIPLFSKKTVDKMIKNPKTIKLFSKFPVKISIPFVKFITMTRGGWGHLMPSIIFSEIYNFFDHLVNFRLFSKDRISK